MHRARYIANAVTSAEEDKATAIFTALKRSNPPAWYRYGQWFKPYPEEAFLIGSPVRTLSKRLELAVVSVTILSLAQATGLDLR
jgi:hypothetical protein